MSVHALLLTARRIGSECFDADVSEFNSRALMICGRIAADLISYVEL